MAKVFRPPSATQSSCRESVRVVTEPSPLPITSNNLSSPRSAGSLRTRIERGKEASTMVSITFRSTGDMILTSLLPQKPTAASDTPVGASATLAMSSLANAVRL